jgi:flagellar export protein FliJ
MAFQFTLDSLLRLRRSEQRQQELLLQKANEEVHRMVREIEALEDEAHQIASERTAAGTSGAEIQFGESRGQVLDARRSQAELRLQSARQQQPLAEQKFQRAWQRREAIATLRERERLCYILTESRLEQRRQDDLFLQRQRKR